MSNKLTIPQDISEKLVKHLVEIEEDNSKFTEEYVFRSPRDRDKLISFFDNAVFYENRKWPGFSESWPLSA